MAERIAIDSYGEIIRYLADKDPTTRRVMEEILAREEEHADDLAKLLTSFDTSSKDATKEGAKSNDNSPKPEGNGSKSKSASH